MKIIGIVTTALTALRRNFVRTSLTVLGVVIGIASVIIVYAAGEGINQLVVGQIESFGTDIIQTEVKVPTTKKGSSGEQQNAMAIAQGVVITTLTLDDMAAVDRLPNVIQSYAGITSQEQVAYGSELKRALLWGVSAAFIDIDRSEVAQGRFFTEAEDRSLATVAVLGKNMAEKLFGDDDPIGKAITVRHSKYRVVGVMEERGAMMGFDFDDLIYLPVRTLQRRLMGVHHIQFMIHQVADLSIAETTAAEIRALMRERHEIPPPETEAATSIFLGGKDDFRVTTMGEMMEMMDTITGALTLLLLAIVAISLVVGGVGIMNIMYVSVTERTAEIGLRKAVGATYSDIMLQFLAEAVAITLAGGLVGIAVGVLISYAIAWGAAQAGFDWPFAIPVRAFVVALGFSAAFGLGFGIYPARRAAKLEPVEALRAE